MSKAKILIVEDETIIALEMEKSLQQLDFEVTSRATDYNTALNSIRVNEPDLIIMDINLGSGKDGIEVAQKIKTIADIPILYLTSFSDEKTLSRALLTNPVSYLIKPYKREELKSNILLGLHKTKSITQTDIDKSLQALGYDYYYDPIQDKLYYKDLHVKLGIKERILFKVLVQSKGTIVPFEELEYQIWPNHTVSPSTLRTLIYRLRSKLAHELIETTPTAGCRLV